MTTSITVTQTIKDTYFTSSEQNLINNYLPSISDKGGFDLLSHLADIRYNVDNFTSGELSPIAGSGLTTSGSTLAVNVDSITTEIASDTVRVKSVSKTIYNDTGSSLTAGQLVRIKGYNGTNGVTVELADADAAKPATHVVTATIANSASGVVYEMALVTGQNTGGRTIGDAVYLSGTAGGFTFTAPTGADQLSQQVGVVKVVNASTGEIEFFPGLSEKLAIGTTYIQASAITSNKLSVSVIDKGLVGAGGTAISSGMTIYNNTGGDLTVGTLVNVSGYTGTNGIIVVKADADGAIPATHVILDAVISNGASGPIYPIGRGLNQNTAGRTIGDAVYLSSTAGAFTFTAPTGADQLVQKVGTVKVVDATVGEIEFFPGLGLKTKLGNSFLQTAARTRTVAVPFKLVAPSGSNQGPFTKCVWKCSQALTIVSVAIGSDTATTGSDATNNYNFMPRNNTSAANLHTSTTTTQGAELSTTDLKAITVSQNLSFAANDVFVITTNISDDGSAGPTNLSAANLYAVIEYTI